MVNNIGLDAVGRAGWWLLTSGDGDSHGVGDILPLNGLLLKCLLVQHTVEWRGNSQTSTERGNDSGGTHLEGRPGVL